MNSTSSTYAAAQAADAALYAAQLRGDLPAIPALRLAASLAWGKHAANCHAQALHVEMSEARQLGLTALEYPQPPLPTMFTTTTTINGYSVELEQDGDVVSCFISKGDYSASLEALLGTGCVSDSNWNDQRVAQSTINAIEAWARRRGY